MSSPQSIQYLFVYGTLLNEVDHPMSDLLQKYTQNVRSCTFNGKLFDAGSFPAAINSDNKSDIVHGNLYKLRDPESVFQHLDSYEGFSTRHPSQSLFIRKKVTVVLPDRSPVNSWIYLYNRSTDSLTLIESGNYLSYLKNKHRNS